MRRAARTDDNHAVITAALREVGAFVQSLAMVGKGCPDLLVSYRREVFLLEVKDGDKSPSRIRLTPDEETWHLSWTGPPVAVVHSPFEALVAIGAVRPTEGLSDA